MVNPPPNLRRLAFAALALLALALRLPGLGDRPMHTDEATNAYIVGQLLTGHPYLYDPVDRHGPTLAAIAAPIARIQGARDLPTLTEPRLRLTTVLAGVITILLFAFTVEIFGLIPSLIAALLFAIAPLPVYYSRDFIHETLFIAVTLALLCTGWRTLHRPTLTNAALTGICAALLLATKETAALHLIAIAAATLLTQPAALKRLRLPTTITAILTFLILTITLFTWFGHNLHALIDLRQALLTTTARAAGQGHQKPYWYYLQLLCTGWSGIPIAALALTGLALALRTQAPRAQKWLALYAILITTTYSAIPYKTPWLALNLFLPITLLAGLAAQTLWRRSRLASAITLAAITVLIAHDVRTRIFLHPSDDANPYAYAQTYDDLLTLPTRIAELAQQRHLASPRIAVIAADPWPLPWYLRNYPLTGYWQPGQPTGPADLILTSTTDPAINLPNYRPEFFGLRTNVLLILWVPEEKLPEP